MQAVVVLGQEPGLQPLAGCSALLPIGQLPAIELTLRWLEASGCNEVHLVTPSGQDQLAAYLQRAGWAGATRHAAAVHVLPAPGCLTEGEALRFVEQKDIIKGDFVLVIGSLVGNADMRPALHAHLTRRSADRQAIMTLLLQSVPPSSTAQQTQQGRCLAVVDPCSQQLLKLEQGMRAREHGASVSTHMFGERNSIAVRTGIRLSSVYICAPEVLVLLSDNFDYQSIAGDLVPGVLSEQELGSTLHVYELSRGYVERICTVAGYTSVVEDVVGRWAYPWVPDNSGDPQDLCRFNRGTYVDGSAAVASGSFLSKGSLVSRGSAVESGARLERCILGSECTVGRGAVLQSSCLHPGVRVDDGCRISSAVLGEQVVVRSHAKVETGALLAKHTVIDTAHCVPAGTRVSLMQQNAGSASGSDDETEWEDNSRTAAAEAAAAALAAGGIPEAALTFDEEVVGAFGAGFAWAGGEDAVHSALPQLVGFSTAVAEYDSEIEEFTKDVQAVEDAGFEEHTQEADQFKREVEETFLRCINEHISHDNAVIELNGLKIAEDRTFADCARYIFTTMLNLCLPPGPTIKSEYHGLFPDVPLDSRSKQGRLELLKRINAQLKAGKALMHRFLKSSDDQVELLLTFEEYCAEEGDFSAGEQGSAFADLFPQVVKLCYDHDLLSEESILDWAREKEYASAEERRFVNMCTDLLSWLEDAEEESTDGDTE